MIASNIGKNTLKKRSYFIVEAISILNLIGFLTMFTIGMSNCKELLRGGILEIIQLSLFFLQYVLFLANYFVFKNKGYFRE